MRKLSALAVADTEASKRTVESEFKDGMFFTIRYTPNTKLAAILQSSQYLKWNEKSSTREQALDSDKFVRQIATQLIIGWRGVTLRKLSKYIILQDVPEDELDVEIAFDAEEAIFLVKNVDGFDGFITSVARDPSLFQNPSGEAIAKNS